jgi:DNA-binding NarL/FixJ family response regulator
MLKDSASKELVDAIRIVADSKVYISPSIAGVVTEDYLERLAEKDTSVHSVLTSREVEVLQLLAEGESTKQTASILSVSTKTIESHRKNIMRKLDIDNIVDLIKYAIREGIISL